MGSISLLASNCIIFGWITLTCLTLASCILLSLEIRDREVDDESTTATTTLKLPASQTWWLFLFWFLANLVTWVTAALVPAKTFVQNVDVVVPPSCCFCLRKPGGLVLMRIHYFLSAGTVILGIVCGVESDLKDGEFLKSEGDEKEWNSDTNYEQALKSEPAPIRYCYMVSFVLNLLLLLLRLSLICCLYILSDDRDSRFSGILPSNVSRNQVAKFRLDHHKMIYKEKRRQSMPAIPRLSDIPEASESQVSSRNVSKLSSSLTDFPADTAGS